MLPEVRTRYDRDLSTGEIQFLVNKGFTVAELAAMYEVPRKWFKDAVADGDLKFRKNTGKKATPKDVTATWTDAKKLAMSGWKASGGDIGTSTIDIDSEEDKAMEQPDLFNPDAPDTITTSGKRALIYKFMLDGRWHSLPEIADEVNMLHTAASATLRKFREAKYGAHTVEKMQKTGSKLWYYRLIPNPDVAMKLK